MGEYISRKAAIDALGERPLVWNEWTDEYTLGQRNQYDTDKLAIEKVPSAQQELTDDRAIEHLQSTGWMQNHDKQMYEMGLKEQLADDSGSYDTLLPFAQPEDYTELKREFIRMASYIDELLECSDEQRETLIGFVSRLAEFMPWTERD